MDKCEWQGCPLIISQHSVRGAKEQSTEISCIMNKLYNQFAIYLDIIISKLHTRYNWPQRIILCETVFDFSSNNSTQERLNALEKLMKINSSPHPLCESEKDGLKAEYLTLLLHNIA